MKQLILIGGGGHCKSCIDVIETEKKYQIKGILDSSDKVGDDVLGYKILGTDYDIQKYIDAGCFFLITIGQIQTHEKRKKIFLKLKNKKANIATIFSPRAYVSSHARVNEGSIIMHDAFVNADACIGACCVINTKATIEHESVIEDFCHVSTGAIINGGVEVRAGSFVGSNAVTIQGVKTSEADFIKAGRCFTGHGKEKVKVAFLTTVFPVSEEYIHDFMKSLSDQSLKMFDLIVLNDGYKDFCRIKSIYHNLNIIELPPVGSIAKNREALIKFALFNNYEVAVFGDIDDYFAQNRIEKSLDLLVSNDIVVNELSSFSNDIINKESLFSARLTNNQIIDLDFIIDKNIFGLSNTAINLKKIQSINISFNSELIAVDWYFYTNLLLLGRRAIFTNETKTYYRQHDSNTVGIGCVSEQSILQAIKVKLIHYRNLKEKSNQFESMLESTEGLAKWVSSAERLNEFVLNNIKNLCEPLWWEILDLEERL